MRVVVTAVPTRRPADYLECMIVAMSDDVTSRVGQPANDVEMPRRRGPVHRVSVVALFARVDVRAVLDQFVDRAELAVPRCNVERSPFVLSGPGLNLLRVFVQQGANGLHVA